MTFLAYRTLGIAALIVLPVTQALAASVSSPDGRTEVTVTTTDDDIYEPGGDEGFTVTLGAATAGTATINPSTADPNRNTIFMGSGSTGGQGSGVWNSVVIETIPEPTATALFGLGALSLMLRRRRR